MGMIYPPLLTLKDEHEYRHHWIKNYCQFPLCSFDNILVRFRKNDFEHAFFESVRAKDDCFSPEFDSWTQHKYLSD
jgi:hypothetical protein